MCIASQKISCLTRVPLPEYCGTGKSINQGSELARAQRVCRSSGRISKSMSGVAGSIIKHYPPPTILMCVHQPFTYYFGLVTPSALQYGLDRSCRTKLQRDSSWFFQNGPSNFLFSRHTRLRSDLPLNGSQLEKSNSSEFCVVVCTRLHRTCLV